MPHLSNMRRLGSVSSLGFAGSHSGPSVLSSFQPSVPLDCLVPNNYPPHSTMERGRWGRKRFGGTSRSCGHGQTPEGGVRTVMGQQNGCLFFCFANRRNPGITHVDVKRPQQQSAGTPGIRSVTQLPEPSHVRMRKGQQPFKSISVEVIVQVQTTSRICAGMQKPTIAMTAMWEGGKNPPTQANSKVFQATMRRKYDSTAQAKMCTPYKQTQHACFQRDCFYRAKYHAAFNQCGNCVGTACIFGEICQIALKTSRAM